MVIRYCFKIYKENCLAYLSIVIPKASPILTICEESVVTKYINYDKTTSQMILVSDEQVVTNN